MQDPFSSLPDGLPKGQEQDTGPQLPDELKGKSAAEIYQALKDENQKMLEAQETKLKAELYDKSKATQDDESTQQAQQYPSYQQPYIPPADEEIDPYTDLNGFMEQQFSKRMTPLVQSTVTSMRGVNRNMFMSQVDKNEWDRYGKEVEQLVDSFNPQLQMHPEAYRQAYNIVLANHLDDVVGSKAEQIASEKLQRTLANLGISQDQLQSALESGEPITPSSPPQQGRAEPQGSYYQRNIGVPHVESGSRSSVPQNTGGNKPRLSPEEKRMAEAFDMTPEEYSEWAKLNTDAISQLGG